VARPQHHTRGQSSSAVCTSARCWLRCDHMSAVRGACSLEVQLGMRTDRVLLGRDGRRHRGAVGRWERQRRLEVHTNAHTHAAMRVHQHLHERMLSPRVRAAHSSIGCTSMFGVRFARLNRSRVRMRRSADVASHRCIIAGCAASRRCAGVTRSSSASSCARAAASTTDRFGGCERGDAEREPQRMN
jgi:hypothetical protein